VLDEGGPANQRVTFLSGSRLTRQELHLCLVARYKISRLNCFCCASDRTVPTEPAAIAPAAARVQPTASTARAARSPAAATQPPDVRLRLHSPGHHPANLHQRCAPLHLCVTILRKTRVE